jgi:hypothetical protein
MPPKKSCCAVVNAGKPDQKTCGVGASYDLDGSDYCKRHYDSALKKKSDAAEPPRLPPKKGLLRAMGGEEEHPDFVEHVEKKSVAPILKKVEMVKELSLHEVPAKSNQWIDRETRIMFEYNGNHDAYAVLDLDEVTRHPLGEKEKLFLKAHNLNYRDSDTTVTVTKASTATKKLEDEQILNESLDEDDEVAEEVNEELAPESDDEDEEEDDEEDEDEVEEEDDEEEGGDEEGGEEDGDEEED